MTSILKPGPIIGGGSVFSGSVWRCLTRECGQAKPQRKMPRTNHFGTAQEPAQWPPLHSCGFTAVDNEDGPFKDSPAQTIKHARTHTHTAGRGVAMSSHASMAFPLAISYLQEWCSQDHVSLRADALNVSDRSIQPLSP